MPEPIRISVVGERGQVAQALGKACATHGYPVRLVGRRTADIGDRAAVTTAIVDFRPQLVINAAAYTAVDKAEDETEQAYRLNRDGAAHVAEAAASVGAPLIHISTDYVFDGSKSSPYVETDAPNPIGTYGASKLAGEIAVAEIAKDNVILRTSWVCSPIGNNFIKTMLLLAGKRSELGVVDDQWGAPTFAADLARAILSVGERLLSSTDRTNLSGLYHATNAGETTWCRFARAIMKSSAMRGGPSCPVRTITTAEYPTRAKRPANSRLDCSKLVRFFDIRLPAWEASLETSLDELIGSQSRVSI